MTSRAAVALGTSAVATRLTYAALRRVAPQQPWTRRNFRGADVTLLAGPAVAAGILVTTPGPAVAAAAVAGLYDDLAGAREHERTAKGFRGHLGALRQGRVSAGAVKVALIGTGALAAAAVSARPGERRAQVLADAALIAGAANLVNLLDLRPGRAAKVTILAAATLRTPGAAAAAGAAAAMLPDDLGERAMLGDAGANPLGAALGLAAVGRLTPGGRLAALAAVAGLTALSERVSFTAVIERTPGLRALDRLGRRPA